MSWISYKPKDIERNKGIRPPRQKNEVDRNKPQPGFYRQGTNGPFHDCSTESIRPDPAAGACRYQMNAGKEVAFIKDALVHIKNLT